MGSFSGFASGLGIGTVFVTIAIAAFTSSMVVRVVLLKARTLGLIDVPNARSSHRTPTPRGGGLGVLAGVLVAVAVLGILAPGAVSENVLVVLTCSVVIGIVGFIDDRSGLSAGLRLGLHVGAASVLVWGVGPLLTLPLPDPLGVSLGHGWIPNALTVLWVVAVTNFFNFMDGVDGLAAGQAVASCVGVVLAGVSSDAVGIAAAVGGASAGFLFHNWPPARIFMGDVGSGSIGFVLGGLPLLAPPSKRSAAVLMIAVSLTFFILDPIVTLVRRALRGEALMKAHREHLYQRLIPTGTSGRGVTSALLAAAALLSVLGAWAYHRVEMRWLASCMSIALFLIEVFCAARAQRGGSGANGQIQDRLKRE